MILSSNMALSQNSLQQLSECLLQTLSPDINVRKQAEKLIESCENQEGYVQLLLQLLDNNDVDSTAKVCSAIAFKNFVLKYWAYKDDSVPDKINENDRSYSKSVIIDLMLRSSEPVQRQLSEAISIIGREDFPAKWLNLLETMVAKLNESCAQYNFLVINGVLQTANSLFNRYQYETKTQNLWQEIKFVLDSFAKPFTDLFIWIVKLIPDHINNPQNIKIIFNSLFYCAKIFYSLNSQDLPEFFEDNLNIWMGNFLELLKFNHKNLESDNPEEPGVLENLKFQICENIGMYAQKYNEEFDCYLPSFVEQVWSLLDSLSSEAKYDLLVSNAINFLTIIAEKGLHKEIFEKEQILHQMVSRVVIPNLEFREYDEDLFENNPEDYIRRDIEGADIQTRRRSACDFVRALTKHFEKPMSELLMTYNSLLYSPNIYENWKNRLTGIQLISSFMFKGGSARLGATSISNFMDITSFFNNIIREDMERPKVEELPVLKAEVLKFIFTFRYHLPVNDLFQQIYHITRHLVSPMTVVHSYAAICIEKLLMSRDPKNKTQALIQPENIYQFAEPLLGDLFKIFQIQGSAENVYAIRAILSVFVILRKQILPLFNIFLPKLTEKLTEVAKNPSKPDFNHHLFEIIGLSINIACSENRNLSSTFESLLFPIFQNILDQDVQDFMPYVFQLLALLLEVYRPDQSIPAPYMELFPFLLVPVLWERSANIAPLVRLIQAYIKNCPNDIVASGKLPPLLGVFQKLISSKLNDQHGFSVINYSIFFINPNDLRPMMKQIFSLLFQRLTSSKTNKFVRNLLVFFSLFIYKNGAKAFYEIIESIQMKMFSMVLEKLFIAEAQTVIGMIERKTVSIGMTKLLTELDIFLTSDFSHLWTPLLQVIIAVFELPQDETNDEADVIIDIEESLCYQSSYSKLVFASRKDEDLLAEIIEPKIFLAKNLALLSTQIPGKINSFISQMPADPVNYLQKYLMMANVTQLF